MYLKKLGNIFTLLMSDNSFTDLMRDNSFTVFMNDTCFNEWEQFHIFNKFEIISITLQIICTVKSVEQLNLYKCEMSSDFDDGNIWESEWKQMSTLMQSWLSILNNFYTTVEHRCTMNIKIRSNVWHPSEGNSNYIFEKLRQHHQSVN